MNKYDYHDLKGSITMYTEDYCAPHLYKVKVLNKCGKIMALSMREAAHKAVREHANEERDKTIEVYVKWLDYPFTECWVAIDV